MITTSLNWNHHFDPNSKRHYTNDFLTVLHCHHYSSLYTQLALDANKSELLEQSACDSFGELLESYFKKNNIQDVNDRMNIGCQYYSAVGLGVMNVVSHNENEGITELSNSHIDEGWIKKWNTFDRSINFITAGYISAMFSTAYDQSFGTYKVNETQSIVMGAKKSMFDIKKA